MLTRLLKKQPIIKLIPSLKCCVDSNTVAKYGLFVLVCPFTSIVSVITDKAGPLPVLFFTANTERVSKYRREYQHLTKPVGRVDLLTQVRKVLDVSEPGSSNDQPI